MFSLNSVNRLGSTGIVTGPIGTPVLKNIILRVAIDSELS